MEEIWKEIPNYEGYYEASNLGRIKSLDRWVENKGKLMFVKGRILKPTLDRGGYLQVYLCRNNKRKNCLAHRLVYEAFIGEIPEGMQVNHKDENKQNNILSNIDTLMTCKENNNWGTHNERVGKAKSKSVIQKNLHGEVIKVWSSTREIEREFGYDHTLISNCCRGGYFSKSRGKWVYLTQSYGFIWEYYTEKATA